MTICVQAIGGITGGALALAALASDAVAEPARLNTMKDMGAALQACWVPPPIDQSRPGMQITVQMSFKRNGELLGQPRITSNPPARRTMSGWPTALPWPRCSNAARRCRSPTRSGTQWPAGRSLCD